MRSGRSPVVGQAEGGGVCCVRKAALRWLYWFSLMRGFAPHPTRGAASGLRQRVYTLWKPILASPLFCTLINNSGKCKYEQKCKHCKACD